MLTRISPFAKRCLLSVVTAALGVLPASAQFGPILSGTGPVNRSMGGAAVGSPLDGPGSLYWNPATSSALSNSIDIGVELLYAPTTLSSSIVGFGDSSRGDNGIFPLPTMALIYRPDDSRLTYGLGVFAMAGFGTNYSASATNPILTPQGGLGALYSEFQVLQVAPTVSLQVTDRLSIGGGPTLVGGRLRVDPLLIASPNLNGQYPNGTHGRTTWGGGFQIGAFYKLDNCWQFGVSYKSPQWFDAYQFQTTDAVGAPRTASFSLDLPGITSIGVGYTGIDRWLLAADFRYIDFAGANGFKQSGFDATGAVQGLGFRSIFAMSLGAQYQMTDAVSLRVGYSYNDNPIPADQSSFNVASPVTLQHTIYLGGSYRVNDSLTMSLAYLHGFQNSIEGPIVTPFGAIPGSSVSSTTSADCLLLGATVQFGPRAATVR